MDAFVITVLILGLLFLYFLPTVVAGYRQHETLTVFVLNLLLGWTLLGWVGALIVALWGEGRPTRAAPVTLSVTLAEADPAPPQRERFDPETLRTHTPRGWYRSFR